MSPHVVESNLARVWAESARTGRRERGRQWYPAARQWAEELAAETGLTVEQVVAVLAITSPGAQLVTNLRWTESIARGEVSTAGRFPNVNAPKIAGSAHWAIIVGHVPSATRARGRSAPTRRRGS